MHTSLYEKVAIHHNGGYLGECLINERGDDGYQPHVRIDHHILMFMAADHLRKALGRPDGTSAADVLGLTADEAKAFGLDPMKPSKACPQVAVDPASPGVIILNGEDDGEKASVRVTVDVLISFVADMIRNHRISVLEQQDAAAIFRLPPTVSTKLGLS